MEREEISEMILMYVYVDEVLRHKVKTNHLPRVGDLACYDDEREGVVKVTEILWRFDDPAPNDVQHVDVRMSKGAYLRG
jgi:hypothetical protein